MAKKRLLLALFVAIVCLGLFFARAFFDSEESGEFGRHSLQDKAGSQSPKRHGMSSLGSAEIPASFVDGKSAESDQAGDADPTLPRLPRRHHFRLRVETSDAKPAAQAEVQVFWEPADDHFGSWSKASAQQELRRRLETSPIVCDLFGQADLPQSRGHLHVLARSKDQRQLAHHRGLLLDRLRPPLLTLRLKPSGVLRLKVLNHNDEPVENIPVALFARSQGAIDSTILRQASDADGQCHFYGPSTWIDDGYTSFDDLVFGLDIPGLATQGLEVKVADWAAARHSPQGVLHGTFVVPALRRLLLRPHPSDLASASLEKLPPHFLRGKKLNPQVLITQPARYDFLGERGLIDVGLVAPGSAFEVIAPNYWFPRQDAPNAEQTLFQFKVPQTGKGEFIQDLVRLRRHRKLIATFVDSKGVPLSNAKVHWGYENGFLATVATHETIQLDTKGHIELALSPTVDGIMAEISKLFREDGHLWQGIFRFTLPASGSSPPNTAPRAEIKTPLLAPEQDLDLGTIEMESARPVARGRIVDAAGQGLAFAPLWVQESDSDVEHSYFGTGDHFSDRDGYFEVLEWPECDFDESSESMVESPAPAKRKLWASASGHKMKSVDIMAFNPEPFEIILQRSHHLSLVVKHDRDLSSDRMIFRVSGPSVKTCLKKWDFQQALALADDTQITAAHMDGLSAGKLELTIEYRPPMEWSNWRDDGAPKPVAAPILARQILDIPIQCPLTIDLRGSFRLEHLAASATDGRPLKSTLLLRGYRGLALPTRLPRQYLQRPAIIRAPGHRPLIFAKNIAPGHHQLQPALRVRGQLRHGEKALSAKGLFCRVTDPYPWGDSSSNDYAVQADGSIEFEVPTTGRYTFWFYQLAGYDPAYELKAEAHIDAAAPPASIVIALRPRFP